MGFGHIYVKAEQDSVAGSLGRYLGERGFRPATMTPARHPRQMKEIEESRTRLYWLSPRLGGWTGVFEFRFYGNEARERWGYTDEALALWLSREGGEVYRLEVLDGAGFWLYAHYMDGLEKSGKAYQDTPADRTTDREHPRYELNRIIEREGFRNIGLGYENIPGPRVSKIQNVPQEAAGVEGLEGFLHLAFERPGEVARTPKEASQEQSP